MLEAHKNGEIFLIFNNIARFILSVNLVKKNTFFLCMELHSEHVWNSF